MPGVEQLTFDDLERFLCRSRVFAWALIVGLPALGTLGSLVGGLSLFAALMAGSFLLATALTCRKALARFTSRTLRLLVAARLVIVLVVGALLCCATGAAWASVVSGLLLWLVADRLLGRYALNSLRNRGAAQALRSAAGTDRPRSAPAFLESDSANGSSTNGAVLRLFSGSDVHAQPDAQPRRRGRRST